MIRKIEPCMLRSEAETILDTPEKKVRKVSKKTKVTTEKASVEKVAAKTATEASKINKAAKLRDMFKKNPALKFKDAFATFEKLGHTLQAAQFYGIRKKIDGIAAPKVAVSAAKRSTRTARTTAKTATATSTAPSVDSILKARNILQTAFNDASAILGCEDAVRVVFRDIK